METDHQRRERLTVFRPESAPTVMAPGPGGALDMSPEASLSSHPGHDLSVDHITGKTGPLSGPEDGKKVPGEGEGGECLI